MRYKIECGNANNYTVPCNRPCTKVTGIFFAMHLRRKIVKQLPGDPLLQKAVAIAVFVKRKLGRTATMGNFTINKLHKLTKISPTTLNKYLPILVENGFARIEGKNKKSLTILNMSSHNKGRNIRIDRFCFNSFKEVYRSLRAFLALIVQSRKDFIKRTLLLTTDPKSGKAYKVARKKVRRLVRNGFLNSMYQKFVECGLSLKRIAKETGNCVRTAQSIMQYAIKKGWCKKQHNFERFRVNFSDSLSKYIPFKHAFLKNGYLYVFHANTYTLSKGISRDISAMDWTKS